MKVIYHDKTGRHLSITIAAIHLQLLNNNSSRWELNKLPYFLHTKPPGTLIYMGLDTLGNEVYVLGRKNTFPVIRNAYLGMNRVFRLNQDFLFADVQPLANWYLLFFDLINSKQKTDPKLEKLLFQGLAQLKPKLISFAYQVRERLRKGGDS